MIFWRDILNAQIELKISLNDSGEKVDIFGNNDEFLKLILEF